MKLPISLMTFPMEIDVKMGKLSQEEIISLTAEAGISAIDIMSPGEAQLPCLKGVMGNKGIGVRCYIATISFLENNEIKVLSELEKEMKAAQYLQAELFMIVPLEVTEDKKKAAHMSSEEIKAFLVKYYKLAVQIGSNYNLKVCFETTAHDFIHLSGIEDCREVLEKVPGLGLVYDTANMLSHGDDPVQYYKELKAYIIHTHLKDIRLREPIQRDTVYGAEYVPDGKVMEITLWGQGQIPVGKIITTMMKDKYAGTFALEYCHPAQYPASYEVHNEQLAYYSEFLRKEGIKL